VEAAAALAIVNPIAGRGKAGRHWAALEVSLRRHFPDLSVRYTTEPGDAERWARAWSAEPGNRPVFADGGDGTVHEVVNGLLATADHACLGIIPLGTGNDFAGTAGVPMPIPASLSRLGATPRQFDVGRVRFQEPGGGERSRCFLNSTSVGVVPHANRMAGRLKGILAGRVSYTLGGIGGLAAASMGRYRTTSMGRVLHEGPALNITIANGARFGAGMRISPASRADDGVLDQVVIGNLSKLRALAALSRLHAGTHVRMRGVMVTPLPGPLTIRREDGPLLVEADGEEFQAGMEMVVDVLPGAIRVVN
jgi:diacylglycerol kinase (ATP)